MKYHMQRLKLYWRGDAGHAMSSSLDARLFGWVVHLLMTVTHLTASVHRLIDCLSGSYFWSVDWWRRWYKGRIKGQPWSWKTNGVSNDYYRSYTFKISYGQLIRNTTIGAIEAIYDNHHYLPWIFGPHCSLQNIEYCSNNAGISWIIFSHTMSMFYDSITLSNRS